MPKPTTMTGWWYDLLQRAANGKISLLAKLIGVDMRTLHRWRTSDIKRPGLQHRNAIRTIAGAELLAQENCPKYLRLKKTSPKPTVTLTKVGLKALKGINAKSPTNRK